MEKTLGSAGQNFLIALIKKKRIEAGLTQDDLADKLNEHQSFVHRLESGQRRIDVIEYIRLADAIGFDASKELGRLVPIILK